MSKAPCRFCGTGCRVMVGVKSGKVVATYGDTLAEVNRGLNCIKVISSPSHVRRRPPDHAAAAQRAASSQRTAIDTGVAGRGLQCDGGPRQGGAEGQGPTALGMSARVNGQSMKVTPPPS